MRVAILVLLFGLSSIGHSAILVGWCELETSGRGYNCSGEGRYRYLGYAGYCTSTDDYCSLSISTLKVFRTCWMADNLALLCAK